MKIFSITYKLFSKESKIELEMSYPATDQAKAIEMLRHDYLPKPVYVIKVEEL